MSLPLLHAGRTNPGLSAALDLRFALDKSLTAYRGPTPSFSRASTGSYFDGSGVLRYAALNLLTYSEDFTNGVWLKTNSSISSNVATSPTGILTADKLVENTAGPTTHVVSYNSATTGTLFSVYAKAGERGWMALQQNNPGRYCYFDLVNGVVGTASGATGSISSAGNGWYRCSILVPSGSSLWDIFVSPSDNGAGYTGNGTSGIFIWGAQLEASSTVGTYCPTTSSANSAPRFNHTFNGTSWVSKGLLVEEQRTNNAKFSEDFSNASASKVRLAVTANASSSPDGTNSADLCYPSSTGIYSASELPIGTILSSTAYTISCFFKYSGKPYVYLYGPNGAYLTYFNIQSGVVGTIAPQAFSATIQNVGNGWYRCSACYVSVAGGTAGYFTFGISDADANQSVTASGTDGVLAWGAQFETGSFATSYIQNLSSSSTTRSADVCQITGSDFSGFWNATEGSVVAEYDYQGAISGGPLRLAEAPPGNQSIGLESSSGNLNCYVYNSTSGGYQALFSASPLTGSTNKTAFGFAANNFAASFNGASALTDNAGVMPTGVIAAYISLPGTITLNGHITRLRYYRKRLPNETLQLLSEPDPTLNLQFALNKTLTPVAGPAPSFSRASTGSYFDSTGTLKYANVNLLTYSEQFDNAAWTKYELTIDQTLYSSPNGSPSARRIIETSNNDLHATWRQIATTVSGTFTDTIYMKAGERQYGYLQIANNANDRYTVLVDLINGLVVTTSTSGTIANQSNSIESVGNGWYRIRATASFPNGGTYVQLIAGPSNSSTPTFIYGCPSYAGDTSKGIYIFGAQLENGSSPSQYAKTEASTTAGPRFDHVYSGGQWVSRGLLIEEQRTNLALNSEVFSDASWSKAGSSTVTADVSIWVNGNTVADRINYPSNSLYKSVYRGFASTSTAYTISLFAKAGTASWLGLCFGVTGAGDAIGDGVFFNLSNGTIGTQASGSIGAIQACGDGWYRCSVTRTLSAGTSYLQIEVHTADNQAGNFSSAGTENIFVCGAQAELGAFATSYIGTTSSAVTRSADVCQITGTSFNWMWNQGEGSVVAEFDRSMAGSVTSDSMIYIAAGTGAPSNIQNGAYITSGNITTYGYDSAFTYNFNHGSQLANTVYKVATAIKLNDFASSLNGLAVLTDNSGTVGTNERLLIGHLDWSGGNRLNGHIAKLVYYPARLTNAKLQQLST